MASLGGDSRLFFFECGKLSAEIVEGKRTVLEYLLSPVKRVASEAGEER